MDLIFTTLNQFLKLSYLIRVHNAGYIGVADSIGSLSLLISLDVVVDSIFNLSNVISISNNPPNLVTILGEFSPDRVLLRVLFKIRVAFDYEEPEA